MSQAFTIADLTLFTGSEKFFRHPLFKKFIFTEGIKFVADKGSAYWLIDAIASYQPQVSKTNQLKDFQIWVLSNYSESLVYWQREYAFIMPKKDNDAILTCWEDSPEPKSNPFISQEIEFTDFCLPEIKLYVACNENMMTLMLPSEY